MIINTTVIVIAAVLLILSIVSPLFNPLFRSTGVEFTRPGNTDSPSNGKLPGISVIVPVHNDADKLDQLLPILLSQQYDGDFQVICVCDKSDDLSEDVASRYKNNTHFYSTFIPDGSHFMSRKKLAITIGVKAARYPWVVLLDAWSKPVSDEKVLDVLNVCATSATWLAWQIKTLPSWQVAVTWLSARKCS